MTAGEPAPASLPPTGLPELDPDWSRLVTTSEAHGVDRTWHILDNQEPDAELTLLCVHGNPTWSYIWRDLLATAPEGVRVIAVDQLDMGFSERTGTIRRLAQRVEDLAALTDVLNLSGPVVTVGHDWGGPISLGWALTHRDILAGIVLMNTAVHQPEGSSGPSLIRMVRMPGVLRNLCETTPAFIRGTISLSRPRPPKAIRDAYEAPYASANRRAAIATFVEDIPLDEDHTSFTVLADIAEGIESLADVPALLLWGPSDPVFSDLYLRDLSQRLPHASIHRFVGAGHLLPEDADVSAAIYPWLSQLAEDGPQHTSTQERASLWSAIDDRADDNGVAIIEMGSRGQSRSVTFNELHNDIEHVAGGMADIGIRHGDRIAILVPPGIDLAVCLIASWKIGAVVVLVDAGLGVRGIGRALKGANPAFLIGIPKALAAAQTLRWPGRRISTEELSHGKKRLGRILSSLSELRARGAPASLPPAPAPDDVAAIGFTSGATGPAKGVVYRHHQLQAQRDAIVDLYGIQSSDRLVAAFGPFALLGTLMGIPSVVPSMSVTAPGSLTAGALADAAMAIHATMVFASPAALANVSATAGDISDAQRAGFGDVRLLLSAGAPVLPEILHSAVALMPHADAHTPYGMTEVMPVADINLEAIGEANDGSGVCVGKPLSSVDVHIDPIDTSGETSGTLTQQSEVMGEICVRADHMRDGYDNLWLTQHRASQPSGWHRTGDVGHIDTEGRLWVEGRIAHTIVTSNGVVTPVGLEQRVVRLDGVALAAVVGVGPRGVQQVVVVLTMTSGTKSGLASAYLARSVREVAGDVDIAAVLVVSALPVDKRHNSKIDRARIATWADGVLSGGRMGKI